MTRNRSPLSSRRTALHLMLALSGSLAMSVPTLAQDYPSHSIRAIVPNPSGAGIDTVARLIAAEMQEVMGTPIIVENRPGAGGLVGAETAAQAPPDGYTLLFGTAATHAIIPAMQKDIAYDPIESFIPIALIAEFPNVLSANATVPFDTVEEMLGYAGQHPGELNYAHAGPGSGSHVAGALFVSVSGVEWTEVPYNGGAAALQAIVANEAQLNFGPLPAAMSLIQAGTLKPLAVSSLSRASLLPDVPTADESGVKGFVASGFVGVLAPAGTPDDVVETIRAALQEVVADQSVKARLAEVGAEIVEDTMSTQDFTSYIEDYIGRYGQLVESGRLQAE